MLHIFIFISAVRDACGFSKSSCFRWRPWLNSFCSVYFQYIINFFMNCEKLELIIGFSISLSADSVKSCKWGSWNKNTLQNLCQKHKNVSYDLKVKLLYYDAAGNNRYKLKIYTCVFDLFIHNVCGYFSAWKASMIQRVLLMYLGITLEPVFRKIKSTQ